MTTRRDLTLLDIADRLIDTGVSVTGEATISVADVDLIYLGLDLALASVDRIGRDAPGAMAAELHQHVRASIGDRITVDPDDVERGLAKLVLTIVEFVRELLERAAIRRMDHGTLTDGQVERVGTALLRLDEKVGEMAARFGLPREELRLSLGPLGELR